MNEAQNTIKKLLDSEKVPRDELLQAVALLWSVQKLLPVEKREAMVSVYLDKLKQASLTAEDQGRLLLLLKVMEKDDPSLTRTIRRKLAKHFNALLRRARPVVRGLLPDKKKKWQIQVRR